eukprot:1847741-Amphidinium_carterae.1
MLCLRRISESVNLDRCNTLITESAFGLPGPQLPGRADSTALVWRQRAGPKDRGSQSLRLLHMSISKVGMLRV